MNALRITSSPGPSPNAAIAQDSAAEPLETLLEQDLTEEEQELLKEAYYRLDLWGGECQPYHDDARECRMIYRQPQDLALLGDDIKQRFYPVGASGAHAGSKPDAHISYFGEITAIYVVGD